VVLIKAPGHTPGSQIISLRRWDRQQYLFVRRLRRGLPFFGIVFGVR
jgi:hypothetical protein